MQSGSRRRVGPAGVPLRDQGTGQPMRLLTPLLAVLLAVLPPAARAEPLTGTLKKIKDNNRIVLGVREDTHWKEADLVDRIREVTEIPVSEVSLSGQSDSDA